MKTQAVRYTLSAALVAAMIAAMGLLMAAPAVRREVLVGTGLGLLVQVAAFWIFFVWVYPEKPWLGYGMGLLARFAVFAVMALLVVPRAGLALAPTMFSLVAVLWLTTMLEPAFLKPRPTRNA